MLLIFPNLAFMKMSEKFLALVVLLVIGLTACGSTAKDSKPDDVSLNPFVSKEGNFSINFPGKPSVGSDTITGGLNMTTYSYEPNNTDGFAVSYTDVAVETIQKEDAKSYLKEEEAGVLESLGVKLPEEEKDVEYDGKYAGLRYKANAAGMYVISQTYVIGTRFYQIEMLKSGGYPTDEEVKNFTDSFRLLK